MIPSNNVFPRSASPYLYSSWANREMVFKSIQTVKPLMIYASNLFTHVYASLNFANYVAEVFELPRYYFSLIGTLQKATTPWNFDQTSWMSVCIVPRLSVALYERRRLPKAIKSTYLDLVRLIKN